MKEFSCNSTGEDLINTLCMDVRGIYWLLSYCKKNIYFFRFSCEYFLDYGAVAYYIWLWMHSHGEYLWGLCKTVQIFEPKNCKCFRLHMREGSQQIVLLKSEADASLKQISIIAETFRIDFHLISMFSSFFSIHSKQGGKWPSGMVNNRR